MIPIPYQVLQQWRSATISAYIDSMFFYTTSTGSVELRFLGTNGTTFLLDWGHGTPEIVTLLGATTVTKNHNYSGAGGTKTITLSHGIDNITAFYGRNSLYNGNISQFAKIKNLTYIDILNSGFSGNVGSLNGLTSLDYLNLSGNSYISGDLSGISGLVNLINLYLHGTTVTGDIGNLSELSNLDRLYLYSLSLEYTTPAGGWPAYDGIDYWLYSTVDTSAEVDNMLIDFAEGGMNNCNLNVAGTNPAVTSASLLARLALAAAGVIVTYNS